MDSIRVVELFAGVGGFRLGLEAASSKFKIIWANQWEPTYPSQYAFKCYEAHFGNNSSHVCKDICQVADEVPEHDLLVGGFPCQDYSVAKSGAKGIYGEKGALWWQIESIIKRRRPRCVVLENVDRILRSPSKQKGRDFSMILRSFYESGYAVEWRVINAADYGQAQRRRRTFIVAFRNDTDYFKNLATVTCTEGSKGMHRHIVKDGLFAQGFPVVQNTGERVGTFIDDMSFETMDELSQSVKVYLHNAGVMMNGWLYSEETTPIFETATELGQVLQDDVDKRYYIDSNDLPKWQYLKGAKEEYRTSSGSRRYLFAEGKVAFPDSLSKPSRTMLTSEGTVSRSSHVVIDKTTGQLRYLTPVECERLNGFPDGWTDMLPDKYRYFTMGNALVVPIVTRIAETIIRTELYD